MLVAPGGVPRGAVDTLLAEHGLERRIARTVSTFHAAPHLVADTDYVLTVSRRVAERLAPGLGLVRRKPPVAPDGYWIVLAWHRRHDEDPEHAYLREKIVEAVADA